MSSVATFIAFIVAGLVPLLPYIVLGEDKNIFEYTIFATGAALFFVGSLRTLATKKSSLRGGMERVIIGGFAAIASYFIGYYISGIV
jgi:VIT1/CCC1 family predicted Fe2+/Mn2+ transporter